MFDSLNKYGFDMGIEEDENFRLVFISQKLIPGHENKIYFDPSELDNIINLLTQMKDA